MVDIVGTSGNGRTKVSIGDIPTLNPIEVHQQGSVERLHRIRVGKVNRLVPILVHKEVGSQLGATTNQLSKVVAKTMEVAGV